MRTTLLGGLLDFWVALEVSWTWSLALWAVVAGLALAYARRERSRGMRAAGYLLAFGAAATVAARRAASKAWRVATGEEPPTKK